MLHVGPYGTAQTPTLSQILSALAPAARMVLAPRLEQLENVEQRFLAMAPDVHLFPPAGLPNAPAQALRAAYEDRTAAIKALLALMSATLPARHAGICPSCTLGEPGETDHYLPKTTYPELAITPWNLVPICGICNKRKGVRTADAQGRRQFLLCTHDAVATLELVEARLSFVGTAHADYFVRGHAETSLAEGAALVGRHFLAFGLRERYARRASGHLAALRNSLAVSGEAAIRKTIRNGLKSADLEPANGWKRPLYRALTADLSGTVRWITGGRTPA